MNASKIGHTLIVDDDITIQLMMKNALSQLGITEVHTCSSGSEALYYFNHNPPPTLIITDLQMPEIDGVELIRHLTEKQYKGQLIIMSGTGDRILSTAKTLAQKYGITVLDVVEKPVKLAKLRSIFERHVATHQSTHKDNTNTAQCDLTLDEIECYLKNNNFVLYCQPKINPNKHTILGVEILSRCQTKSKIISPLSYIPVMQYHSLLDDLTKKTIITTFSFVKSCQHRSTKNLKYSINIPAISLEDIEFVDFIMNVAHNNDANVGQYILEVTEDSLSRNTLASGELLTRLRLKGFGLSIDDFGTGFSNLVQLNNFPFTELKIDRQFVHNASINNTAQIILEFNIKMAKKLKLDTVVEGVEQENDLQLVKNLGCDMVQGFYYAKPFPIQELPNWVDTFEKK